MSAEVNSTKWACDACTFHNDNKQNPDRCSLCNTPRSYLAQSQKCNDIIMSNRNNKRSKDDADLDHIDTEPSRKKLKFMSIEETKQNKEEQLKLKLKLKLKNMIIKTQQLRQRQNEELESLIMEQIKYESLLEESSKLSPVQIRNEIKNITKSYKNKSKSYHKIKNRTESLPNNKSDIGDSNILYIFIDGNNMIQCGKKERYNKTSMDTLCNEINNFLKKKDSFNLDYDISVYLWYDENGINHKNGNVNIEFSGNGRSINDILDARFISNNYKNLLFVTNAHGKKKHNFLKRMKLYRSGVTVFKSATFYRNYLVQDTNNNDNYQFHV